MRFNFILPLALAGALAACAKQPENIAAIPVAGDPYSSYSCNQLVVERNTIQTELTNAEAAQRDAAAGDAIGVLLLGLPLSSMSGADREANIAVARGRIQEIDRLRIARNCATS